MKNKTLPKMQQEPLNLLPTYQFNQLLKTLLLASKDSSNEVGLVVVFMGTLSFLGVILSLFVLVVALRFSACPSHVSELSIPRDTNFTPQR